MYIAIILININYSNKTQVNHKLACHLPLNFLNIQSQYMKTWTQSKRQLTNSTMSLDIKLQRLQSITRIQKPSSIS